MNYNKVTIAGRITQDIELRYTPSGTAVADITIAINRVRKGEQADKIEECTFVDVTLWGRVAEIAHQYSGKGKPLFIDGRLQTDSWKDKETGQNRSKLKVIGEQIQLLGSGRNNNANQTAQKQQPNPGAHTDHEENDDIPF